MYFSYNSIFSYPQYPIKLVIGARGIGKTYGAKRYCIKKFLNENKKFVWIRDTMGAIDELEKGKGTKFFVDVAQEFTNLTGQFKNGVIYINGKACGYYMSASTFYNAKGTTYSDCDNIVYDEFIPEKGQRRNKYRVEQLLGSLETILRTRKNVNVILLANALDRGDEILNIFNFKIDGFGLYVDKKNKAILQYADDSVDYKKAHAESIVGNLIRGTKYENVILKNKFEENISDYFDKLPTNSKCIFRLYSLGESVKVYNDVNYLYVTTDNGGKVPAFVSKLDDMPENCKLIDTAMLAKLKQLFLAKSIKFNNANIKRIFYNFILSV